MSDASATRQIDAIVRRTAGWRGERLSQLRALIRAADPGVIEEVKWKKPSRPEGVPVWSHDGIVCIGEALKNAVRLTFPKGAQLRDPKGLFNTRLDSKTVRAIDFHEGDAINASALKALILEHTNCTCRSAATEVAGPRLRVCSVASSAAFLIFVNTPAYAQPRSVIGDQSER